ncbi:MAG: hypothetical protein WCO13_14530 [Bacteroidota bacterium]
MKKNLIIILFIFIRLSSVGQTSIRDSSKVSFSLAYDALKSMLEGKDSLNYEKAVFITENAYHNNYFNYEDFKHLLDFHTGIIKAYAENVRNVYQQKYKTLNPWEQCYFKSNTDNWAIFKYITDTAFVKINEAMYYKKPYSYTYQDPYGSDNWENTEVLYLLLSNEKQGNCYSLASLFKIFSVRLKSDARLTIAPHHIYIQNRNQRGDFYNVELASKSFPGDGTIQCLTYTTFISIKKGMAQRMLNDKQAVALNLIYLAKGFQHKYKDNTNDFLLQCANLAYKYDSLSLNALLLKAEITENSLLASMKELKITTLLKARIKPQTQELLASYETQLSDLYTLGYREIPKDIERLILAKIQHREEGVILKDKTPNPFASIKAKQRYATLSNGRFDEIHEAVDSIQYYHALLNTKTKKIIKLLPTEINDDYKVDPVVFALSVDPLSDKYPSISPYAYCIWNPVKFVDPNGKDVVLLIAKDGAGGYGHMGAVIQDGNGKFYYMTVGNADANAGTFQLLSSGNQGGMVLQPLEAKNMTEAVSLAKQDQNNSPYTDQVQFNTSTSMDKAIYGNAQELQKNINSGETKYNALTNNCADAVVKTVEKGTGIKLPTGVSPKPNDKFAKIKENAGMVQNNIDLKTGKAEVVTIPSTMDNVPAKQVIVKKPVE